MSSKTKYIQGILTPRNLGTVDDHTRDNILNAAVNNGLGLIIKDLESDWTIKIDSQSLAVGGSGNVYGLLPSLRKFFSTEGVKELDFEGTLMVSAITDEPVIIRIAVKQGQLHTERAYFSWSSNLEAAL